MSSVRHRLSFLLGIAFLIITAPTPARGATTQGVLPGNETWTGTISIVGDVTVPTGVTLTIAPGAVINFAGSDSMGAGADTSRTELIVNGTLSAQGTAASPIQLKNSSGSWYGVRLLTNSSATFDRVTISGARYGVYGQATFTFKNGTVSGTSDYGMYLAGGSPEVATSRFLNNNKMAVRFAGGTVNFHHNEVRGSCYTGSSSYALQLYSGNITFDNNTVAYNTKCYYAVYISSSSTASFTDNIVASNHSSGYGVYYSSSSYKTITNNLIWGHSYNTYRVTSSAGVTYNPLFVSSSNLRITSRSPARKAGSGGVDLGALPYVSDATPKLEGVLFTDLTLAAGTHAVPGDLLVATGVTLTLQPGATLSFAGADEMKGGADVSRPELVVNGTLSAQGSAASPIQLKSSSGTWYGVRLLTGSSAAFDRVTISGARYGVYGQATFTFKNGTVSGTSDYGMYLAGGSPEVATSRFLNNNKMAVRFAGGTVNFHHNEVRGSCNTGSSSYALQLYSGNITFDHNTVAYNTKCYYAVYISSSSSASFTNSIVASNHSSGYGVYYSSSSYKTIYNNLIWGHSYNTYRVTSSAGVTSNPLFVTPPADLRLQATSPARNKGNDGSDLGCYPYQVGPPSTVVISPTTATVKVKGVTTYTATAYDASNNPIPSASFTWSASAGGSISSAGVFTASCAAGTFTGAIKAAVGSISDTADVTVTQGDAVSVKITPAAPTVQVKGTLSFTAQGADTCGNSVAVSPAPTWKVSGTTIGSITSGGVFTAGCTTGTHKAAVTAQSGSLSGGADVTISAGALEKLTLSPLNPTIPTGSSQSFTAQGADTCGNGVTASVSWSVAAGGGTITAAGVFTAGSTPGTFVDTIQATAGSVTARTSVTVAAGKVASVVVTPNPGKVVVGKTVSFSAQAYDSGKNPVTASFTWSTTAGGGTVSAAGVFTAGTKSGTFVGAVVATAEGVAGKATVQIDPGAAATVTVAPATITVAPGGGSSFTATVKDGLGNVVTSPVTWTVSPTAAGAIDSSGKFTAGTTLGTYPDAIRATAGAAVGKATVVIKAGALHHLVITPTSATLKPSATVAFSVEGRDGKNNLVAVTPKWSVVATGGTINNQGIFAAGTKSGTFQDTVQAVASGLSVTATVVVEPGPLNSIALTPTHATLKPGGVQIFAASGTDSWGNSVPLTTLKWSADPGAGAIDSSGKFTAGNTAGDWSSGVTATMKSVSASAGIRIGDGGTGPGPDPAGDEGCSCRVGADSGGAGGTWLLLSMLLLGLARRRRRR